MFQIVYLNYVCNFVIGCVSKYILDTTQNSVKVCPKYILNTLFSSYLLNKIHCKLMREVFLLMNYNLTTLKIYFKQGRKFKIFVK